MHTRSLTEQWAMGIIDLANGMSPKKDMEIPE